MATPTTPTTGKKAKLGRGIRIVSQSRMIISNVYDYFKKLHVQAKGKCKPASEQTVEATGVTANGERKGRRV